MDNTKILETLGTRRVLRYQKGNQNPYIEEEQTTQWPNVQKVQKNNNDLQNISLTFCNSLLP
jgi:hypothetical protein